MIRLAVAGAAALGLGIYLGFFTPYTKMERHELTVIASFQSQGRYSSSPVLVVKDEKGRTFDLYTTYSAVATHPPGSKVYYNLREFDIKQTGWKNVWLFFFPVFPMVGGAMALVVACVKGWLSLSRGEKP